MADICGSMRDSYNLSGSGNFRTHADYERAKSNGDIDSSGYDRNGNHYNCFGDRDYDSGYDSYDK